MICNELHHISSLFLFLFFPDRHNLKFLEVKCNPTNKKTLALTFADVMQSEEIQVNKIKSAKFLCKPKLV